MAYKMKGDPMGRNFGIKSPLKNNPNPKKRWTTTTQKPYVEKPDSIGSKIVKAVTPENSVKGMLNTVLPVNKAIKAGKAVYNYFKQG